jgi:alanine racemase
MEQGLLTVDCGAVVRNWRRLVARHAPGQGTRHAPGQETRHAPGQGTRHAAGAVAAVVKADAYGLGAAPVARALHAAGCTHFFVAHPSEGEALRDALGSAPMIAVLDGFAPGAHPRLTPVLNSLADVRAHAAHADAAGGGRAILHLDTGMSRLGLDAAEAEALIADPAPLARLDLAFVMTHLACADEPEHPLNAAQAARFEALCARLPPLPRSLANSSGIFLGPRFASDLARPGAALYGLNPTPGAPNPMESVVTLEVPVLQVREIAAGETVGYGAAWTAPGPARIATCAEGYADGWRRALSGKGFGVLHGRRAPLVGRVSMDLTTFDVTDIPEARAGDMIRLLGPEQDADAVATLAGTIGYEVLTSLGRRFTRVHLPA